MAYMLERPRAHRAFDRADILSRLGETICLPTPEILAPITRELPRSLPEKAATCDEEDPERWDGLS